jgi:glycosyltransferase involved in cell wall biosynthesis
MPEPERLLVGVDASAAAAPQPTGIGLSIAHLIEALALRTDVDPLALYRLSRARRQRHFLPGPHRLYHERWSWLLARRLHVFHGADARLPRFAHPALVATVHDLSARRPGFATDRFRATREAHWKRVVERAHLVVTYTEAVREEVHQALGIPLERIAAVPLAPTRHLVAKNADRRAADALTGGSPYVLFLGELSRRKNAVGAVEAFAAAGDALAEHRLVLAGPRTRFTDEVEAAVARLGLGERVVIPAYLPAGRVAALLDGASAFLFPSRYEGFGMPVLEAFRAGVPVVASTDPSVVEVAGDAALHADADDADGLGAALVQAVQDPDTQARLAGAGLERLASFSWSLTAARLADVYRAAYAGRGAPAPEVPTCSR